MNAETASWFLGGLVTGGLHACMLWRASQSVLSGLALYWARLMLTGVVLFSAAVNGGIAPAAVGWAIASFGAIGVVALRTPV